MPKWHTRLHRSGTYGVLSANLAKSGALLALAGRLVMRWHLEPGPRLRLRWAESGEPPVAGPPHRNGSGSRVLTGTVSGHLGGGVSRDWKLTGSVCDLDVPLNGYVGRGVSRQSSGGGYRWQAWIDPSILEHVSAAKLAPLPPSRRVETVRTQSHSLRQFPPESGSPPRRATP
jgi:hypothetical protein